MQLRWLLKYLAGLSRECGNIVNIGVDYIGIIFPASLQKKKGPVRLASSSAALSFTFQAASFVCLLLQTRVMSLCLLLDALHGHRPQMGCPHVLVVPMFAYDVRNDLQPHAVSTHQETPEVLSKRIPSLKKKQPMPFRGFGFRLGVAHYC